MENTLFELEDSTLIICGTDEAGRGPLAGPVVAAAVVLPDDFPIEILGDSKKLSERKRIEAERIIKERAIWATAAVSHRIIDEINILNASIAGMWRAVMKLSIRPEFLLVDGNRFKPLHDIPYRCIVKGDGKYASIAAASVLAKTYRDEYMRKLAAEYPQYGWERNMGYPTREHIEAIRKYGYTPYHRKSFHVKELEPTLF